MPAMVRGLEGLRLLLLQLHPAGHDPVAHLHVVAGHQGDGQILGEVEQRILLAVTGFVVASKIAFYFSELLKHHPDVTNHIEMVLPRQLGNLATAHGEDGGVAAGLGSPCYEALTFRGLTLLRLPSA